LLQAACLMLVHLGKAKIAEHIQNALLKTLEDGIHTADIYNEAFTKQKVTTKEFAQAIIQRLGQEPSNLKGVHFGDNFKPIKIETHHAPPAKKRLLGADVFLDWVGEDRNPNVLGKQLEELAGDHLQLKMITNRGVKVYPNGQPETFCTDHWRCRFVSTSYVASQDPTGVQQVEEVPYSEVIKLLNRLTESGLNFIKLENLYEINGKRAFSLGQGE
jgi:isocitrate dehydrogenase